MKNFVGTIFLIFSSIICGYGQSTFGDRVAILKVEDPDGTLDPSGVIMLQSAMVDAFSKLQNVDVVDYSGVSPNGGTFQFTEIMDIGKRVSADIVIIPSVSNINGHEIFLSTKMLNVKTKMMEANVNARCDIRDKKEQAAIFKKNCEDLAVKLSNRIVVNQMGKITFSKGKLYRGEIELSEKEIKNFFVGDKNAWENWKAWEERSTKGPKRLIAGSVLTSLGLAMTAAGTVGMITTKGWGVEDTYRALSIAGVSVGSATTFSGLICFCCSTRKKVAWKNMEKVFLERQEKYRYTVELQFGNQRNGVGFALKF